MRTNYLPLCVAILAFAAPVDAASLADVVRAEREGACASLDVAGPTPGMEGALVLAHASRCLMLQGQRAEFAELAARFVAHEDAARASEALPWWPEVEARAALHDGRAAEAEASLLALARSPDAISRASRARHWYYAGLAAESLGAHERADEAYQVLVTRYPASEYGARVAPRFADARWSHREALDMAEAALDGRHYEAAESLYTLAACGPEPCSPREAVRAGERARYEAAYQLGWFLYRFRREHVARALPWLETLADARGVRQADARYAYALAVERMQRFDEARRAWDVFLSRHRGDERAAAVPARVAWSYLEEHRWDDAIAAWSDVVSASTGDERERAAWWLGWAYFRNQDPAEAQRAWREVRASAAQRRVRYWSAVCEDHQGRSAAAHAEWRALRDEAPFEFYGLLSARRIGEALVPDAGRRATAPRQVRGTADVAERIARLGLIDEARLLADPRRADDELYRLAVEADPMDWVRWTNRHRDALGAVPTRPEDRRAWELAHPAFYADVIRDEAERNRVPQAVLWAIMQKESSYRPDALSGSDAMGLMQVIPQTALAIAGRLDEPYVDGMLFEPFHAIRYGAWYVGALARTFDAQWPVVVGAYNAGPVAMRSWLEAEGGQEFDVFVESMAYRQARDYVRRVTSIAVRYAIAHADDEVLRSPTLGGLVPERIENAWTGYVTF